MKNFKDITISIFAIIGFVAILSSFNSKPANNGKYDLEILHPTDDGITVHTAIFYMLNTENGNLYFSRNNESWKLAADGFK